MRNILLLCLAVLCRALAGHGTPDSVHPKSNIILIIADDQGYGDLSCYPHDRPVSSPHIDALAKSGVLFTNGYATHHGCAPSRAAILSGRYQQRIGFYDIWEVQKGMPAAEKLLPQYLKEAGYYTGLVGKWHLGEKTYNHPLVKGYDRFFGFLGGMHDYFNPAIGDTWDGGAAGTAYIFDQKEIVSSMSYLTDEFTNRAIDFIKESAGRPFFLHLAYSAPHGPMQAPDSLVDQFMDTPEPYRKIRALNWSLDQNIGRLLAFLERTGLRNNTLIFYLSDNGGTKAHHNGKLRGYKGNLFEGGIRVPFLMSYPGTLPAGKVFNDPVIALDIFPTILAAAGINMPNDKTPDGINLMPFLTSSPGYSPHEMLYWSWDPLFGYWAVRSGKWKAIREEINGNIVTGLFDLEEDIGESKNLLTQYPEKFRELEINYRRWISVMPRSLVGDNEWTPNGNGWKYRYEKKEKIK